MSRISAKLIVDFTHIGRRNTGIERLSEELFGPHVLSGLAPIFIRSAAGKLQTLLSQQFRMPLEAARNPTAVLVFPGFPPPFVVSWLYKKRTVFYVHDLFFITRKSEANFAGRHYLAPQFSLAIKKIQNFLVNSQETKRELQKYCEPSATILLYRPQVKNVFGLQMLKAKQNSNGPFQLVTIGTIEPRKNLLYAARLREELSKIMVRPVILNIVGRRGWGHDYQLLSDIKDVKLHGTLTDQQVRQVLESADAYITTSHNEGLGLPALEVQHGGIPVIAPNRAIFREVLGDSALFIELDDPGADAMSLVAAMAKPDWQLTYSERSFWNVTRWNREAERDSATVMSMLWMGVPDRST